MSCKTCKDNKLSEQIQSVDHNNVMKFANIYTKIITFSVLLLVTPFIFLFVVLNMFSVLFFKKDIDFTNGMVKFVKLFEKKNKREVNTNGYDGVEVEETDPDAEYIPFDEIVSETKQ